MIRRARSGFLHAARCRADDGAGATVIGWVGSRGNAVSGFLRRHRRFVASTLAGSCAFAVCVGIANACGWEGMAAIPHPPTAQVHAAGHSVDDGPAPGHAHRCGNAPALLGVLALVQDRPNGQPLVLAAYRHLGFPPIAAPPRRLAQTAHLSRDVPLSLRSVRLAL